MPGTESDQRDCSIVERILSYCGDVAETHAEFGFSKEKFIVSRTYQNAVGMCILQIGELIKHLTPTFVEKYREIDWKAAARARDIYAHHYGRLDLDIAWDTATTVIDELRAFCKEYLQ